VVTNGHVVQPFYEKNEASFVPRLLEAAVAQACGPALEELAGEARAQRIRALAADPGKIIVGMTETQITHGLFAVEPLQAGLQVDMQITGIINVVHPFLHIDHHPADVIDQLFYPFPLMNPVPKLEITLSVGIRKIS